MLRKSTIARAVGVIAAVAIAGCGGGGARMTVDADAAQSVYVAPGDHDELYAFMSGGFSGNVSVYGLPSGRLLQQIPVFSQYPEKGYGYSEQTKALLETSWGFIPWDDSHHPQLSVTGGEQDGRWLFINGMNTPRVARIDLATMETDEILELPHTAGSHASPFLTENSEYLVSATRFSVPTVQRDVSIRAYKEQFAGVLSFVRLDPEHGSMSLAFQVMMPGFDYDLARAGKGRSHGWAFFTSYNSEQAFTMKEIGASQADKDFIAAINWKRAEACVAEGKAKTIPARYAHNVMDHSSGVATTHMQASSVMLNAGDCPNMVYFLPTPKSPHGTDIDPTGELIVAGGKLATVIPVHSFSKMIAAIEARDFDGEIGGVPVLKYEATIAGEVQNPGLGPLHTEFDGTGHAYTSVFISSEIVKWSTETFTVVDRVPTYYSVGHLMVPGGDTKTPYGKYVIALNKITKDRYLPTGPELTQSAQLYDISGPRMRLLLDFPTVGEPHYAQALPAKLIKDRQVRVFAIAENNDPYATKRVQDTRVQRRGTRVDVYMTAIRSNFMPDNIEGIQLGDSVFFHVTNLEQDWDVPHGFAMMGNRNAELLIMPGRTRTLVWVPQRVGVYPFYCTDFCSALHQEMQGYVRVSERGANVPLAWNGPNGTLR